MREKTAGRSVAVHFAELIHKKVSSSYNACHARSHLTNKFRIKPHLTTEGIIVLIVNIQYVMSDLTCLFINESNLVLTVQDPPFFNFDWLKLDQRRVHK